MNIVQDLTEYFSGNYGPALLRELNAIFTNIPEESHEDVARMIREDNAPNFKLGVKAVVDACRKLGIPYRKYAEEYTPAKDWKCECCGLVFKYAMLTSETDKHDKGIFDYCPRCGMQPTYTIEARKEIANFGKIRAWEKDKAELYGAKNWYEHVMITQRENLRKRKGHWLYDKKEDDEYEIAQKKKRRDEFIAETLAEEERRAQLAGLV
jgi:hypothetical protein